MRADLPIFNSNSCLKTGDVCDYSVRLNWEGRRTKRSALDEGDCGSLVASNKPIQWFHEFSAENSHFLDPCVGSNQDLDSSGDYKMQQSVPPTTLSENATTANNPSQKRNSVGNTLVFIDESQQLLSGAAPAEGYIAKKRLANSQGTTSVSSPRRGSQLNSPALGAARHKKTKSFTELTKLDIGQSRPMPCPRHTQGAASSATWFPYSSVFDGPLTPAPSSHSDDIMNRPNWAEFQPLGSPDSLMSGNEDSENSPTQSGYLWEEPGTYSLQETLSNSDVYPSGDGALYGYDTGAADEDVLKSDNAHSVALLPPAAYNSAHGIVDFGEEAICRQKRDGADGLNLSYYKNVVPVVIPWALEPLPDM